MILIPSQEKKFSQNNQSNVLGNIWSSFNLDLSSNLGRLKISPRVIISTQQSEVSTISTAPCAFKRFGTNFYTIAGVRIHTAPNSSAITANWSADTNTPTNCDVTLSDLELFNSSIYATTATTLNKGAAVWTANGTSLNTATTHMMTVYGDRLYITDLGYKIYSMNTSDVIATSGANTFSFTNTTSSTLTFIRAASDRIWFGTVSATNSKGYVYDWDGISTTANKVYRMQAQGALACVIKDDIPWIMDSNGRLLVWNGATFVEKARLPLFHSQFLKNASATLVNNRFIHPNGMSIIDGRINILINNVIDDSGATINENLPSGIWEYDESIGLYHKQSFSLQDDDTAVGTITDYSQNRLSTVGALADMKNNDAAGTNGTFFVGATIYTNASSTQAAVFLDDTNDTIQKSGYFVTTWIDSQNVQDIWQKLLVTYKEQLNSTDKIILKYRTTEADPTYISITWVDTDTFTTATDVTGKEGYEVEIIQGTGSGKTAHITSITGTYTVNLDDTFTGVTTGTAKARLQAWTKLGEITTQTQEWSQFPIGTKSPRIQLKCCIISTGKNEIHRLALINSPHQLAQ